MAFESVSAWEIVSSDFLFSIVHVWVRCIRLAVLNSRRAVIHQSHSTI